MIDTNEFENKIKNDEEIDDDINYDKHEAVAVLNNLIEKSVYSKSMIGKLAGLDNYIYEMTSYSNNKNISRDKIIALLIVLKVELDLLQRILKAFGYSPLYVKKKRDLIIFRGITKAKTLHEIEENLDDNGFDLLITK